MGLIYSKNIWSSKDYSGSRCASLSFPLSILIFLLIFISLFSHAPLSLFSCLSHGCLHMSVSLFSCLSLSSHVFLPLHMSVSVVVGVCVLLCVVLGCACCCGVCVSSCLALKKKLPCVRSKRSRVYFQNERFERTHGSVSLFSPSCLSLLIRLSFSLSLSLLVSLCLLSARLSFFLSLSFSALSITLSITMTLIARPVGSLCTHGSILPDRQSAWTLAESLSGEHVRITQETVVQIFLRKPRATSNEVGLYLCWRSEDGDCVCVCACYVFVSDVVCCHCCRRFVGCVSVGVDALAVVR